MRPTTTTTTITTTTATTTYNDAQSCDQSCHDPISLLHSTCLQSFNPSISTSPSCNTHAARMQHPQNEINGDRAFCFSPHTRTCTRVLPHVHYYFPLILLRILRMILILILILLMILVLAHVRCALINVWCADVDTWQDSSVRGTGRALARG